MLCRDLVFIDAATGERSELPETDARRYKLVEVMDNKVYVQS